MSGRKIPTVSFFRFLRHASDIVKNPLPFHHGNFEKHGDIFRLKIGLGNSVIFSRNPAILKHALQKNQRNYTKSKIQTKDLKKYVGQGLLTAEGSLWKTQRKLIQPAFHKKQLVLLLDTMLSVIKAELAHITTGNPIDIAPIFNNLAFQTVAKSLFSSNVSEKDIRRLQFITEEAQKMLVKELRQPFKGWYFKYFGRIKKHLALTNEARVILKRLAQERRESNKRYDDLLDMLLDARYEDGTAMDESQLIDEILILFVAGHETTSNALTFIFQLLAKHPDEQEKICKEYDLGKASLESSPLEFLKQTPYTKQVIEEAMRMYPPAYFIDRVNILEDSCEGYVFPSGSNLLFSVIEMHNHPDYWEHPEVFNPSRFENNAGMKHEAYFPFGAGPRMCIGNNFAVYEMVLAVTQVISRFKIAPKTTPIEVKPLITLKPQNAILEFIAR